MGFRRDATIRGGGRKGIFDAHLRRADDARARTCGTRHPVRDGVGSVARCVRGGGWNWVSGTPLFILPRAR
jgi:hypothetical protein